MNSPHQRTANTRNEPVLSTLRGWELCGLSYDASELKRKYHQPVVEAQTIGWEDVAPPAAFAKAVSEKKIN